MKLAALDAAVPCGVCDYDLRATPAPQLCPECGTDHATAVRLGRVPVRPAWADSDPRWRRRILAALWALTLLTIVWPFVTHLLRVGGVDVYGIVPVPTLFDPSFARLTLGWVTLD